MIARRHILSATWLPILTGHAFCALAWWWLMPGGFPISHPRFWTNQVLPWLVVGAMLLARFAKGTWLEQPRVAVLLMLPCIWLSAAVSALVVYPTSFGMLAAVPAAVGGLLATLCIASFDTPRPHRTTWILGPVTGCVLGGALPPSQKTWHIGTRPAGDEVAAVAATLPVDESAPWSDPAIKVYSRTGGVVVTHGQMTLGISPLLTLDSRSPDGCLVLFAGRDRRGPVRTLAGTHRAPGLLGFTYRDDDVTTLTVENGESPDELKLEAVSVLPHVVWSHLNSFNELTVAGHRKLSLRFSACPQTPIDVQPMDYPKGRPARFGYLDSTGILRIVEATSAEKGPFHELASGPLGRGDSLAVTLLDDGSPRFEITFADFASQADTQLSPTAGWRVPVNSIEFRLSGDAPSSPAEIFISLASTSVGRGYDSVGHAAGVYRNRVTIRRLP